MRVLIYLLMIITATALSLGVGLVVGFELQDASRWLLVATAATTPFIVMGPAVIGAFAGYWDHRSSPESRRYLGWWFAAVIAVEVVAAVFIVLATLSARAPLWVPVVLVLGAAVLLAVARPLGALFRRTERPIPEDLGPSVPDGSVVRRKLVVIGVTFVIAAAVATIGAALLTALGGGRVEALTQTVLLAGQLTFTATAMATLFVALPFSRALRDAGGRDIGRLRRFAKVVLRGKDLPLDGTDARGAVRYAQILPLVLQFQLGFTGLLYVAIVFQCLSYVVRGDLGLLPEVFLAAIVVVLALVFPLTLRRIRRARRYVDRHVHAGDRGSGPDASAV
ncbi:hypothetical protein GCM10017714_10640 [Curtobacterium pusillum]|uniref:Uncharacterized protein n=1 Tax=Curtobacterium pusillum TaxID=69373 RepID=A0ABX2M4N1_9MICO|nr:hypothetical protein [Curtobacterium pusillum]NUU12880.1 hypothetical protein [Curtobacterium pusillum]GLK30324.1 hypothetical protein GCM10017610_06090 [Curtobacterium pusillum]